MARGKAAGIAALAVAMALAVPLAVTAETAGAEENQPPTPLRGAGRHSSDGMPGTLVLDLPGPFRRATSANIVRYEVVPGLSYQQWDRTDRRGTIRAYLLKADLSTPGLRLEYASAPKVRERLRLRKILLADEAVAGVNGDFFDIHDTSAPLGVGVDDGEILHGPRSGWTTSLVMLGKSIARIREATVSARVVGHPEIDLTNVNSPFIPAHSVGVYTSRWGDLAGYRVVDGARKRDVRQVVVQAGVVVSNTRALTEEGPVTGKVLVGRGYGASALADLEVGSPLRVRMQVADDPRVAISGSEQILRLGRVQATDDVVLHPRTAVGIDRDTNEILLLVVDGRQDFSRGYTLVELAKMMRRQGAEDALNLDGGGSSTMVARDEEGKLAVLNSPSDGHQRPVPNGLEFTYTPPADPAVG